MTDDQGRQRIINLVQHGYPVKATVLVTRPELAELWLRVEDPNQFLEKMVADGLLVEVTYVAPDTEYRAKSVYFPAGTVILG